MKRIVVTPAGRRAYMDLLAANLEAQRAAFDEWHLWLNTADAADVAFCKELSAQKDWVKTIELPNGIVPSGDGCSIHHFFPIDARDPDALYIRIDDDVVWLSNGFVGAMFDEVACMDRSKHFLMHSATVNNAVMSWLFQRRGLLPHSPRVGYTCMDDVGWRDAGFAVAVHDAFVTDLRRGEGGRWKFDRWVLLDNERVSINCIAWHGADFDAFGGRVGADEEEWLSVQKPRELGKTNVVWGGAVCVHFAFFTQRGHMQNTGIEARLLGEYRSLIGAA
jgi:hypothetical protein